MKALPKANKLIAVFLCTAIFVIMPFIYSNYLQDVEQSLRFLFLSIVVSFIVLLTLIQFIKQNTLSISFFALSKDKLVLSLTGFLMVSSVALFFSINKGDGIFEVLKLYLFYLFFICCLYLILKDDGNKKVFIQAINIAVLIFTAIALVRFYPVLKKYFDKHTPVIINYALSSSLGNKNFYAETLFLCLPFIINGILIFKTFWKVVSVISVLIIVATLVILQTLSTWAALAVALLVFVAFIFRLRIQNLKDVFLKHRKIITGSLLALVIFFTGIITVYVHTKNFTDLKNRVSSAANYISDPSQFSKTDSTNNNSTFERMILWRNTSMMIKDHPLGNGIANWKIYFPKYGMTEAQFMNSGFIKFIRPHNDFLLFTAETGVIGLLVYLSIFFFAFKYGNSILKSGVEVQEKIFSIIMLSGIAGYFMIACFSLPNDKYFTVLLFMLMIAFLVSNYHRAFPKTRDNTNKFWKIVLTIGLLISVYSIYVGYVRLKSDTFLSRAIKAQRNRDWNRMSRMLSQVDTFYFPIDYTGTPISWYKGFASFYAGNQEEAFIQFKQAEKANPYHTETLNDIGTCYNLSGNTEMAYVYYQKILQSTPLFSDAIINLSALYYNAGKIDSAYMLLSKPFYKSGNYRRNLQAVLLAKAAALTPQIQDSVLQNEFNKAIQDGNFLFKTDEEARKNGVTFEQLLLEKVTKNHTKA